MPRRVPLQIELLEDRLAPAALTWDGGTVASTTRAMPSTTPGLTPRPVSTGAVPPTAGPPVDNGSGLPTNRTGSSNRFFRLSEGFDTAGGESSASLPAGTDAVAQTSTKAAEPKDLPKGMTFATLRRIVIDDQDSDARYFDGQGSLLWLFSGGGCSDTTIASCLPRY